MKGFPKIVVARNIKKMKVATLCSNAKGVKTDGDSDVVNPPYSDAAIRLQADKVSMIHSLRITDKRMSLTRKEEQEVETLRLYYDSIGRNVQDKANEVAKDNGSIAAGEAVVLRCGFKLKKKRLLPPRMYEIVNSGPGWIHFRVKSAGKYAAYIWRFGFTNKKGVIPEEFMPVMVTMSCELIITHSFIGKILGAQVACVIPNKRSARTKIAKNTLSEQYESTATFRGNKPVVEAGMDAMQWSDFIYQGLQ